MPNTNPQENNTITLDHVDAYFNCLTLCDTDDGNCYEHCILTHLKQDQIEQ